MSRAFVCMCDDVRFAAVVVAHAQRLGEDALEKASMDYTCEIESLKANSSKLHSALNSERSSRDELDAEVSQCRTRQEVLSQA